ncbi:hypothetical protein LTR86_006913 [Recurvomyces mirabilis]|nr:hypothetical protein LTR86_006913 [Recurvomyces mirabilis]
MAQSSRAVYHVPPIHQELRKKRASENGAWRYPESHEFVVYHKIPANAIIHVTSLDEVLRLANKFPAVGRALNFEALAGNKDSRTRVRPQLESARVELLPAIINAMARFLKLFGLGPASTMEQISYMVADIVQDLREYMKVRMAFLDGLRWGLGIFNVRHSSEGMALMMEKATVAGLGDPAKILADELDAAKLQIDVFGRTQHALVEDGGRSGDDLDLIEGPGDMMNDDADEDVVYNF